MRWVAVVAGLLDLLENIGIWICTNNAGSSSAWLDPMWAAVAAAAWAKYVLLFGAVAYVIVAAVGYVVTPPWVRNQFLAPTSTNVVVSSAAAIEPEAMMVEGTPAPGDRWVDADELAGRRLRDSRRRGRHPIGGDGPRRAAGARPRPLRPELDLRREGDLGVRRFLPRRRLQRGAELAAQQPAAELCAR